MNGNIKQANYFHLFLNLLQSVSLLPAFALEQLLSEDACSQSDREIVRFLVFLAVKDSSISDIVCLSVGRSLGAN